MDHAGVCGVGVDFLEEQVDCVALTIAQWQLIEKRKHPQQTFRPLTIVVVPIEVVDGSRVERVRLHGTVFLTFLEERLPLCLQRSGTVFIGRLSAT
jgi:hypothetical protein